MNQEIFNMTLHVWRKLLPGLRVLKKNFSILAFGFGQWRTIKEGMAVDANGDPIPWYTYPAIEYLESFDFKYCDVFEFGSGNSSLYWAKRARSVCSVEDNQGWFNEVSKTRLGNQEILHRADEASYVKSLPSRGKLFEIIVVDGNWRYACAIEAINCLKDGGMIVLDNSDRKIEKECGKLLRKQGFLQIDFSGFGPINNYTWSTSIFIKSPVPLQKNFAGPNPIGGLGN
jgi:hypothetical protein